MVDPFDVAYPYEYLLMSSKAYWRGHRDFAVEGFYLLTLGPEAGDLFPDAAGVDFDDGFTRVFGEV